MLLRQEVERRKLIIIRKLLGLGLTEINGQTLDQLTLTQLEGILIASLQVLEGRTMPKQLTILTWNQLYLLILRKLIFTV